ncbi:MAG: LysR family transcriptional regulator [Rhodoplanes sp.]|uniref:winged helix-turn-helix domain-containing protein n=1 Tax=Rhodoplanes sp. TaxID=1968906 RepID=UPI00181770CB|nr:LysR family transcriptional regulator [Rhodoplanes sp.]NVO15176.1 LysR family transcriptional regulator [Rhodoplanes sp.]
MTAPAKSAEPSTVPAAPAPTVTAIELRLAFGNGGSLDPEDIRLLETIRRVRSILGASRALGTSYRKCWLMVDALNHTFETAVVDTFPGRRGGGAALTVFGERLIALYRSLERQARKSGAGTLAELTAALDPDFEPRASGAGSADPTAEPPRSRSQRT